MKNKHYVVTLFALCVCWCANSQVLRTFTPRYSNPSVKGNIVFVANNIVTSTGVATTEVAPGGSAVNNNNAGAHINVAGGTPIINAGDNWKYLVTSAAPAGTWQALGYNDAAWPSAPTEIGYGDGDEATVIGYGPSAANKYPTTYFRKSVTIANPAAYTTYRFDVERDDGYVVYVNGVEVGRDNMPGGAITYATYASTTVEDQVISFTVPSSAFLVGVNDIAVEVHQGNASSSDLSFNLALTGIDPTIINSSTADLSLPTCTHVLFAGLYWGASQGTDGANTSWITNETTIKLKIPGSAVYQNLVSTQTDYHNNTLVPGLPHTGYRSFVNITSLVNATAPNGTYTVANVTAPIGINNASGGWTIVIAYADPATIVRNLTVFDGSAIMNGGDPPLHIPITGFLTPPTGPVSCELGAVVFDGDRVSTDEFSFKQNSNPLVGLYTSLTPNATSNFNDMWNSTISYKGTIVTARNPAHQNTLGYDADIIDVPNVANLVLGNSQNSASIRFSSPSENYMLQVATTAISQYTPSFNLSKTSLDINGGTLVPGDHLRYQVNYTNGGNDASTLTTITDNIPTSTTYKPNTIRINGVAKTDAAGDDEAEYDFTNNRVVFRLGTGATGIFGGEVAPGGSGNVSFEVYTASSCAVAACNSTISNRARITYGGKLSLISLADSSGTIVSGCNTPGPVTNVLTGSCVPLVDTILVNNCPTLMVMLPASRYAGYRFYTAFPFIAANLYNPATPITFTRTIYAFFDGPGSCDDTRQLHVYIIACPDIDDDNDGLPDFVEIDNPLALADHDADGRLNWNDPDYPGYGDNNADGFNDNFDPSADSDNDGVPNFYDAQFPGFVDTNGDGVNDRMDKDLDGIPNHLDLDSDNDGIPDTVESFGVDANGDGRIDNYTDTDNDGFSQNVDGNNTGVISSSPGLGPLDTDGDGIPNYLDLDSDNDGIPDVIEVYGTDANNNGRHDNYVDTDSDGYNDAIDSDVGNDGIAENLLSALLRTSADLNNDGRCDSWPFKNMDADSKPNPYDLDSDGDGITDVKEALFTDANNDGRIDGAVNADGWNSLLPALVTLGLPNTDNSGRVNPYDIDSDNDGIPDNVEGLSTLGYILPAGADSDGDGIDNAYDNFSGFGGNGITPYDKDGDTVPDYRDLDTDNDGLPDRTEGNDFNFNGLFDDLITLLNLDIDDDGLDDRFDANNLSAKATSAFMGNGGSFLGDLLPGSITVVQHTALAATLGCPSERDWRCIWYVLSCDIIDFNVALNGQNVKLDWQAICRQEVDEFIIERSTDRINFHDIKQLAGRTTVNERESYTTTDDLTGVSGDIIYYRLRTKLRNGQTSRSSILAIKRMSRAALDVTVAPNPVKGPVQLMISSEKEAVAEIRVIDVNGKLIGQYREKIPAGSSTRTLNELDKLPNGVYHINIKMGEERINKKMTVIR